MSNPLAVYLHALEARDAREQKHVDYINAYTKLADRRTAFSAPAEPVSDQPSPSPSQSSKSIRPGTPKGRTTSGAEASAEPSNLAQIRAALVSSQKARSDLKVKLADTETHLSAFKLKDNEQRKRIAQLERQTETQERRIKDLAEELKEKGKLIEEVQDEMISLQLQLNVAETEKGKLKKENEDLARRFMEKMEEDAQRMNESIDRWTARR